MIKLYSKHLRHPMRHLFESRSFTHICRHVCFIISSHLQLILSPQTLRSHPAFAPPQPLFISTDPRKIRQHSTPTHSSHSPTALSQKPSKASEQPKSYLSITHKHQRHNILELLTFPPSASPLQLRVNHSRRILPSLHARRALMMSLRKISPSSTQLFDSD